MQKHGLENKLPTAIANELENALYSDADSKVSYFLLPCNLLHSQANSLILFVNLRRIMET